MANNWNKQTRAEYRREVGKLSGYGDESSDEKRDNEDT